MDFRAVRVVVTGAASGIGRAIGRELASRGAQILLADIDERGVKAAALEIGDLAHWARCDVSDHADVLKLAQTAWDLLGGCDLIFANAGVIANRKFTNFTPAEIDWVLGVNIRGAWSTAAIFAKAMTQQTGGGHVVFTGSEHSIGFQHPGAAIYTASKHAVLGLAEALRAESPANLRVSICCPGLIATALGTGPRPDGIWPASNGEVSRSIQSQGMSTDEAARRAVDGVAAGEFYIVSHPHAIFAAEKRMAEIDDAFQRQAPWFEGAEKWDVNRLATQAAEQSKVK